MDAAVSLAKSAEPDAVGTSPAWTAAEHFVEPAPRLPSRCCSRSGQSAASRSVACPISPFAFHVHHQPSQRCEQFQPVVNVWAGSTGRVGGFHHRSPITAALLSAGWKPSRGMIYNPVQVELVSRITPADRIPGVAVVWSTGESDPAMG